MAENAEQHFFFFHSDGKKKFSRAAGPSVAAPQLPAATRWNSVDVSGQKINLVSFWFTQCERRRCVHAPCGSQRGKSSHPSIIFFLLLFYSKAWRRVLCACGVKGVGVGALSDSLGLYGGPGYL